MLPEVYVKRFGDAQNIQAAMHEEALVFGRYDRLYEHVRQIRIVNHDPLGTSFIGIVCDELRRKLPFSQRPVGPEIGDAGYLRTAEADTNGSGRSHDQAVWRCGKCLRLVFRSLAQTAAPQGCDDFRQCFPISHRNRFRRSVEVVCMLEWTGRELFVDTPG